MYYHHLVRTIYEPLLEKADGVASRVVVEARKRLETLLRLYYIRHGFEAMHLYIVIPLMLAGSNAIESIDDIRNGRSLSDAATPSNLETLRATLILVLKGLSDQRRNHYLAEALFRVTRGRTHPADLSLLAGSLTSAEELVDDPGEMAQAVRSHWPVSIVKRKEDMDSHDLGNLVNEYAHLNTREDVSMEELTDDSAGSGGDEIMHD